jgi:Zn-dependent protease
MKSSIQLGNILGIPIGVNYSWIIIFTLVTMSLSTVYFPNLHPDWSPILTWVVGAATSLLFFVSVIIHELAHSAVSLAQGVPVRSITLFMFGGVASISEEPRKAQHELVMALAGPISSLCLSLLFWLVSLAATGALDPVASLARWLAWINLTLALFNLIPGFPLDGGRVLRALVWWFTGSLKTATRVASVSGRVVAYAFITFGILMVIRGNLDGLWLAFLGWFLEIAASQSYQQVALRESLHGMKAGDIMNRECAYIPGNLTVDLFVHNYVLPQSRRCFLTTEGGRPAGMLTLHSVKEVPREKWQATQVRDIMMPLQSVKRVRVTDDAWSVLQLMDAEDVNQVPVMDGEQLVGLISRDNVLRFIRTRSELGV